MGQQQILLIVLGMIVVGVAIVLGFAMFDSSSVQASRDSLTNDMLHLSSLAVAYYHKPAILGGGGNSFTGWQIPDSFNKYESGKIKYKYQAKKDRVVITGTGTAIGNNGTSKIQMKIFVYPNKDVEYKLIN
jgi:hypothetical protein